MEGVSLDKFFAIFWTIFQILFGGGSFQVETLLLNFCILGLGGLGLIGLFAKQLLRLLFWYFNYLLVLGINFEALLDIRWLWRGFKIFESNLLIVHSKNEFSFFHINQNSSCV